ncbi:2Fe-2S iron-sulfur cluster-binding protein [Pseudomonas aeruginosa]|uniref:2Fe-2S iron-sulfur cluster-binding protein n=1 Tax=Pseudomonas aeruginosa TaxID=287 RepID=UPI0018AB1813|nr:2Fe-2S iron-sulfur cluster-binding protein [Pseudomonas aeruginosa]MBF8796173.1 hypothetical protein [Pseudomonas aeruginosa]MBG6827408.1 hypothetical protein [Pseudomonas aeruginosa]MBN7865930.1 hypothetical protein [Pseudomonas aeruginosa]MCV4111303.1 hypothetical protein [Pseudomonas aeruginosa]MCV4244175.1 hypothetical protein [Pseudomonas aeruginosa]
MQARRQGVRAGHAGVGAEAGVELPASCEPGICDTCLTRVPEHRDLYFGEKGQTASDGFTPCYPWAYSPRLLAAF